MKIFARVLALLLALLMCAAVLVACEEATEDDEEEEKETVNGGVYDATKDENGRLLDALPDDLNYFGEKITTLYWSDVGKQEFESETITGDNVSDAIYDRNSQIMDRLNVELAWASVPGDVHHMASFVKKVEAVANAGTNDYDLIATYSRTSGILAVQGYLVDMNSIENSYLDLEKPWWPQRLLDTVNINGSMYFISGDCSTNVLHLMYCLYFNKSQFNQRFNNEARAAGFDNAAEWLYGFVTDGKWTLDKLIELTSNVYEDLDKSGSATLADFYGFATTSFHADAFYTGSNLRLVEHDETEILKISPDYGSRKTVLLVQKLGNWMTSDDCWAMMVETDDDTTPFKEGRTLFKQDRAWFAEWSLLKVNFSYGLVPTPKYDEKQVNYYTCEGNPFTLYGIFSDFKIRDNDMNETLRMISAVLECWGSEAYRLTTPEIFEVNMQLKYSETDFETQMFEYVRSNITFDLGRIFSNDLAFMSEKPSIAAVSGASWSTSYAAYKKSMNAKMTAVVEQFKLYQGIA